MQDFKKSPENPFNQATVAFDATKEEKVEALRKLREETEARYAARVHRPSLTADPDAQTSRLRRSSS